MSVIFDSVRFKLNCKKWRHSRCNFLADVIGGDYWKVWGGICAYFDQTRYMIVITQLKGYLNNYVIDDDVIVSLTWYVSKGLKFWKIISEGKGWKMASSMSTFEIFWWVVSDMSISSIIVGRRMCRVSAKRWKLIFDHRTREKRTFLTQRCRFRHENTEFVPKISISTQKHQVKNTVFESKLSISTQKYRFWTSYTDFDSKIPILARNAVLFTCSVVIIIDLMYLLGVTFEASPSKNSKIQKIQFFARKWPFFEFGPGTSI